MQLMCNVSYICLHDALTRILRPSISFSAAHTVLYLALTMRCL